MAGSTILRLRVAWFQLHKWIGILLAVLIIPISLTGSALVWHDWLDETLNPERKVEAAPALPPAAYAASAARALGPEERIASITYPDGHGAVLVAAARPPAPGGGRPVRTQLWLHPETGAVLDRSASNEGAVHIMHVLHGSLMVPGLGRQIVGWIGVAMLISSLTGLWLWWPLRGRWTRGLRWKRQATTSANLHHQTGFWVSVPLAMLSFTGVWISFPAFFASISGAPAPDSPAERIRRMGAQPLQETDRTADQALAAAQAEATGPLLSVTWPTDQAPEWKLSFARSDGPAEVKVADATGTMTPPKPPKPETTARTMRRWHDGTGMGVVWQVLIFIGGILPALLAVTGIMMWLKSRVWRGDVARRRRARAEPALAE